MWRDHPFSQRNKETEQQWVWGLEVTGKWGDGVGQNLKKESRLRNMGGLHKIVLIWFMINMRHHHSSLLLYLIFTFISTKSNT